MKGSPQGEPIRVETLTGHALARSIDALAALRISVFRAFPYLYYGDAAYERAYLNAYIASRDAVVIGAFDGDTLVGAATAAPMEDHAQAFAAPFDARGHDLTDILYCGESVLLPAYRGKGLGHAFFDGREAHARALGRRHVAFCAVIRAEDHPARPMDYAPLDPFWRKRGYAPLQGMTTDFAWKDIGDAHETPKPMQFWMKAV
ncbi:GNAT family N-acetyltransferase [Sphingobium boeckii]|nr:GNAT family N-acetyltransferase [Sphingobium boeckii]